MLILLHPWGLKWILWGHFLTRSNRMVKQKEARLCSGRSKLLIPRKKDKVSLFWFLLPTLCQQVQGQDQLDFLFIGGNSSRYLSFWNYKHKAPPQHGMYPANTSQGIGTHGGTVKPLGKTKKIKRSTLKTLTGHIKAARTCQSWIFWQEEHTVLHTSCSFPGAAGCESRAWVHRGKGAAHMEALLPWHACFFPVEGKEGNGANQ